MLVIFGMFLFVLGMGGWSFIWKALLGLAVFVLIMSWFADYGNDNSDPETRIRSLEEYQHSLGNTDYTYEKDCNDQCQYWIRNKDGTIDRIGGKR